MNGVIGFCMETAYCPKCGNTNVKKKLVGMKAERIECLNQSKGWKCGYSYTRKKP